MNLNFSVWFFFFSKQLYFIIGERSTSPSSLGGVCTGPVGEMNCVTAFRDSDRPLTERLPWLCGERRSGLLWATAAEEGWAHRGGRLSPPRRQQESIRKEAGRERVPWWSAGYHSGFSLPWSGFNPWPGNWDPTSRVVGQKKRVRKKGKKGVGSKLRGLSRGVGKTKPRDGFVYSGLAIFAGRGWKTVSRVTVCVKLGMKHWSNYKPERVLFYVAQGHFICCENMKAF